MTMLRLDPPIPVLIRREDAWRKGLAHVLLDYGYENDLCWVVFEDESRECWTARNRDVRAQDNVTMGRMPVGEAIEPVTEAYTTTTRFTDWSGLTHNTPEVFCDIPITPVRRTVVDELVVSLSLDSSRFEEQCRDVLIEAQRFKTVLSGTI